MSELAFIAPFFIVADLRESVSFYTDKLGFELHHIGPEPEPYFAMLGRGAAILMLKGSGLPVPNHSRYTWAAWDAFISANNPEALYEEFKAKEVTFSEPLGVNTDNLKGFAVTDPNGYRLYFGRPNLTTP